MIQRPLLSLVLAHAALVAGCSELHSGQAGDTNTSWLRICEDDNDCTGSARCLAHLCTVPCAGPNMNSCVQLSDNASCRPESRTCDVSCDDTRDCRALGADYRCELGSCRPKPEIALNDQTLRIAPDDSELGLASSARRIQTIWLADRFRMAATLRYESPAQPDAVAGWRSTFVVTDMFLDGRVERQLLSNDARLSTATFTLGNNGGVARRDEENDEGTFDPSTSRGFPKPTRCRLTFYDPSLDEVSSGTMPCEPSLSPITSDENGDWLAWQYANGGPSSLGRYRPSTLSWVDEPQLLAAEEGGASSTQVRGDRFWIQAQNTTWGTSSLISIPFMGSLDDLSVPEAWRKLPVDARLPRSYSLLPLAPHQQGGWRSLVYQDGWLIAFDESFMPTQPEPLVRALPVEQEQSQEAVSFAVDAAGTIGFSTLRQIPGRDLVAICYLDRTVRDEHQHLALKLGWFDTRGAALGEPLQLASSGEKNVSQCSLTWSGSTLLATWLEGAFTPFQDSVAFARRVRVH